MQKHKGHCATSCTRSTAHLVLASSLLGNFLANGAERPAVTQFHQEVEPLLKTYCYTCHGDGESKGGIAFDEFATTEKLLNRDLWFDVLKNLRARIMPPQNKPRPTGAEQAQLEHWIKYALFAIDRNNLDPGRVTVRRLNRVEYRNTIHDLMGIEVDAEAEFPPDDTGYGFDTIGDVLTVSPMLLEKYVATARLVVAKAMPDIAAAPPDAASESSPVPPGDLVHDKDALQVSPTLLSSPFERAVFAHAAPSDTSGRRDYARELLGGFATRAFRRPVTADTLERLVTLAERESEKPGASFERGIAQALTAVLASPRFLFRLEKPETAPSPGVTSNIDEYSLASRLSYFLWSSTPDDELLRLARTGELRRNLETQVRRMLADSRSGEFIRNFTGQWLQIRDLEDISINEQVVLARDQGQERQIRHPDFPSVRFGRPRVELDHDLRDAMRRETEMFFAGIVREDRPVTELIESDYSYLNEHLARLYGVTNVTGPEMRRVTLPAGSARGGVLTDGSVLVVTSNPGRTSPVKRGRFILENFLGTPSPPPPPNIPTLETAETGIKGHEPTLREALELHRTDPACAACHGRMDPLGLAFENFNALGMWRDKERNQRIDPSGRLVTGESFQSVRELKHILATGHREDFYRCLTEKLLTYAVGRGMDCADVETIDQIVDRLDHTDGRLSALLLGVIESAPFQKMRLQPTSATASSADTPAESAPAKRVARRPGAT